VVIRTSSWLPICKGDEPNRETFASLKRGGRGGFIPFITAGDPDIATTELLLIELAAAGADIIELGVPFSDPVADGEVIQRASERALRNWRDAARRIGMRCASKATYRCSNCSVQLFQSAFEIWRTEAGEGSENKQASIVFSSLHLIPEEAQSWTETLVQFDLDPIFLVAPYDIRRAAGAHRATGEWIHLRGSRAERDCVARD